MLHGKKATVLPWSEVWRVFHCKEALAQLPRGGPLGLELLAAHGITAKHASALLRSGWLQRLGRGAYSLPGDELNRDACLAFLAQQLPGLHVAARTALAWRGVRHNLAFRETVVLWGDQPARLPAWLRERFSARYRVAHIFDPAMPAGLGLAPLPAGRPDLLVSTPERALLELLSETGSFEGLEEVRHLVESTRNLREPVLDELLGHLNRIKVARLAARLATELELPGPIWPCATAAASAEASAGWPSVAPVSGWIWWLHHEPRLRRHGSTAVGQTP